MARGGTARFLAGVVLYGLAGAFFLYAMGALVAALAALTLRFDALAALGIAKLSLHSVIAAALGAFFLSLARIFLASLRAVEEIEGGVTLPPRARMRRPPASVLRFAAKSLGLSLFCIALGALALMITFVADDGPGPLAAIILVPCALVMILMGLLMWGLVAAMLVRSPWLARRLALSEAMGTYSQLYDPLYREPAARTWIGLP